MRHPSPLLPALLLLLLSSCTQPTPPQPPAESAPVIPTVVVYDTRAFFHMSQRFSPPSLDFPPPPQPATAPSIGFSRAELDAYNKTRDQLIHSITSTIDPPSWKNPTLASIRELNGQLIILQTPANHAAIRQHLDRLEKARNTCITLEFRLIEIDNATRDALQLQLPFPSALNPTSQLRQILDDDQLAALLKTVQAAKTSQITSFPRGTLVNSQTGYTAATHQQNLITSWSRDPDPSSDKPYLPTLQTLTTGTVLQVQPTLSPDRRYIILKLQLSRSTLDALTTAPAPNTPPDLQLTIQIPQLTRLEIPELLVSVPTNSTLLIAQPNPKNKTTTLLLVAPQVIDQKEEETRLFGPGYDRPTQPTTNPQTP